MTLSIEELKELRGLCNDSTAWDSILNELIAIREQSGKAVGRIEGWDNHQDLYIIQWFGNQQDLLKGTELFTAPQSPVVPEGWQMVPVEITNEMRDAWDGSECNGEDDDINMMNAYRAMLSAAPKPE